MLKVLHIQNSSFSAGRAALRLHTAFLDENIDSGILSMRREINDTQEMKNLNFSSTIAAWIDSKMQSRITRKNFKEFGQYSYPLLGNNVSKNDQVKNADVIYLHWVQGGFLNLTNIEQLAETGKPIIIFMHDMWSITGGCHHSFSCEKYTSGCNTCQMFPKNSLVDWASREFNRKMKIYSKYKNLYFVAPSKWLYNCAKKALLTKDKPIFYIPNIIDNQFYKSVDKQTARQILGIDSNDIVISFGAASIDSPYKGWKFLQEALEILNQRQPDQKITVLIFGCGYNKRVADAIPFKSKFTGFLSDEYSTVLVYNASDVFIIPSIADNQPTTVMESLCCGTPVVGFDVGGIPDMIKHKENGYLAKYKSAEDIANGIEYCRESRIKGHILPAFERKNIIKKHQELIDGIFSKSSIIND